MIFEVLKSLGFPLAFFALSNTFLKGVLPFSKGFRLELASKRGTFLAWNSEILGKFSQKPAKNTDLALAMSTKLDFLFYLVYKVSRINFEVKWKLLGQIRVASCMDPLFFALSRHAYRGNRAEPPEFHNWNSIEIRKYRAVFSESSTFKKVQEHKNRSTDSFSNNFLLCIEKLVWVGGAKSSDWHTRTSFGDSCAL